MSTKAFTKEPFVHVTKRENVPFAKALLIRIAAVLLGLILCGIAAYLLIPKLQEAPDKIVEFYNCFIKGSFSTNRKLWKFLKNTAILLSISLAVTPAFRMRFWNIGAEGQTLLGVLSAIAVNFYLGGKVSEPVLLILMFFAAIGAGILWGLLPAVCKAKWGTNETLFTLMMNYIATYLVEFFLVVWVPSGSSTLGKLKFGKLPSFGHEYLVIILISVITMVGLYLYLYHSKQGYEISVVGESERTAQYVGISVPKVIIRTMILSGALCGLTGYLIAAGLDQSVTSTSVGGQGFTAIMVSWLAKFNPIVMVFTAALIIILNLGGAQISQTYYISDAFPNVVIGIILFFIIGCEFFLNYELHFRSHHAQHGKETAK